MENILDFQSFIKTYYPEYKIDGHNLPLIKNLSLWCLRSSKFNGKEEGWHIDKGLCLTGNVGTGKTELFRKINRYLNYIHSPYIFNGKVVWKFADEFKKDGYECFEGIIKDKNIYFDELALTDETSGQPTREYVGHYGDKVLVGREVIMQMYNKFENTGYQSHFSSNLAPGELEKIYGERAFSRLFMMCNFMVLAGEDRRFDVAPSFKTNKNQPAMPRPWQTSVDSEKEGKDSIDLEYAKFLTDDKIKDHWGLIYNSMVAFGIEVCTDEDMLKYIDHVSPTFNTSSREYILKRGEDKEEYRRVFIWNQSRQLAVYNYFTAMKRNGAGTIFGEVATNLESFIRQQVIERKEQS